MSIREQLHRFSTSLLTVSGVRQKATRGAIGSLVCGLSFGVGALVVANCRGQEDDSLDRLPRVLLSQSDGQTNEVDAAEADEPVDADEPMDQDTLPRFSSNADPFSEPLRVLDSVGQRSEMEEDRVVADAYYLQGRLLRRRDELGAALRSYQRAWRYLQPFHSDLESAPESGRDDLASVDEEFQSLAVASADEVGGELLELCLELEREIEATRYAKLVSPVAVRDPANLLEFASLLTEDESYDSAVRYYRQWLRATPDAADSNVVLLVRLEIGRLCYLQDRFEEAADEFQIVLNAYDAAKETRGGRLRLRSLLSDAERTFALIAEGFLEAGRLPEAAAAFERANEAAENENRLALNLGRVALAAGDLAAAEESVAMLLELKPNTRAQRELVEEACQVLREITMAQQESDDPSAVVWLDRLSQLISELPHLAEIDNGLPEALVEAGQIQQAIDAFDEQWERSPSTRVAEQLLELYPKGGDPEAACAGMFQLLVDIWTASGNLDLVDPDRDRFTPETMAGKLLLGQLESPDQSLVADDPVTLLVAAVLCSRLGKWELADSFFTDIESERENDDYDRLEREWVLELLAAEQFERAVAVLEDRLERSPDQAVETRFLISGALGMLERNEEASDYIGEVQALLGDSIVVRSRVAWIKQRQQDYDGAKELHLASIRQFGQRFDDQDLRDQLRQVRIILAGIASEQCVIEEAEEWLLQVLDEYPADAGALNDLGYLWVDNQLHLQRGYTMVKRAVEAEPENASYLDSLGWAAFRLGRYDEAETALQRALELRPNDPESIDHLGDVYASSDRLAEAHEAWKRAAEIYKQDQNNDRWNELQRKILDHETN